MFKYYNDINETILNTASDDLKKIVEIAYILRDSPKSKQVLSVLYPQIERKAKPAPSGLPLKTE